MIIFRIAGTDFTAPVKRETDLVQLFAVAIDIVDSSDSGVLSGLDGILFCGQTVCVISHRVEYIEALQSFVTGINIRSNVSQRMSYV